MGTVVCPVFMGKIVSVQDEAWLSVSSNGSTEFMVRASTIVELFLLDKISWLQKWQVPVTCFLP